MSASPKFRSPSVRPRSPHLQIYRPQWTSVLSILHRLTGVILSAGAFIIIAKLFATALGGGAHQIFTVLFNSVVGQILVGIWLVAMNYHLCNGIRHLCWDCGWGLELKTAYRSGVGVVVAAIGLTIVMWICT